VFKNTEVVWFAFWPVEDIWLLLVPLTAPL